MTLYAFDDIDDAIDATRALLWPFDLRRWAKLAFVVFFLGGAGAGANPFQYNAGTPPGAGGGGAGVPSEAIPDVGADVLAIVAAVVAVALLIGLVFLLVGSIMEFVFVEALRRETVSIRRAWGEYWRRGVRLFGFRLVLGILTLVVVGTILLVVLAPIFADQASISIGLVLFAIPVFLILAIVVGLVSGFTTVFVVPIMMVESGGVLAGWRRFWGTLTDQWRQYLAYAVMGFVLQLAGGLVAGIASVIVAVVLLIPFGIVGLAGAGLLSVSSTAGWVVIGVVAAVYLLTMLVAVLFISVPVQTFLRYYALLVLGDTNEDFDLIAERRRAIRE